MPFVRPSNKILVAGSPIVEELLAENTGGSDDLKPGMLVIKGTGDHQVKYAGAGAKNVQGIADYDPRYKITDAFPEGTSVRVLKGSIVVVATLAENQTINKGDALIAAASGEVKKGADIAVAVPSGATAVTSTAAQPDLTESGSIPPDGIVVGHAEESVTTGAGETKPIMMRMVN